MSNHKSTKNNPKSIKHRSKFDQKSTPNRPKINPNLWKFDLGGSWGVFWVPKWPREPTWPRKFESLNPLGPPSWEPKSSKNRSKIDPKLSKFSDHFVDRFWSPLGADLIGFWAPKWSPNWSRIGPKSDHEANAKIFKILGRGNVLEDPRCLESIKNRS